MRGNWNNLVDFFGVFVRGRGSWILMGIGMVI